MVCRERQVITRKDYKGTELTVALNGHLDTNTAPAVEAELRAALAGVTDLVLDCTALEYISSSGLRTLLRLRKTEGLNVRVTNVSREVYEVFDMTGFTSMMTVEKALRFVSAEGLEQLGAGVHSTVYRLDAETILKVVKDMTLDAIRAEMSVSKTAFAYGIPTAISYDVVRSEEGYGEVYEMLNAGVLSAAIMQNPDQRETYLRYFVDMYREIHTIDVSGSGLDSAKDRYLAALDKIAAYVSAEEVSALRKLIEAVPDRTTFVHGDYHMNNVMLQDGELLLIDVGEAGYGHPLFDFAQTAWVYYATTVRAPERCQKITGMGLEEAIAVRDNLFPLYFGESGEHLERKMTVVHAMALLRMLLVPILQDWRDRPDYTKRLALVRKELIPDIDMLCDLIKSEFE